MTEQFGSSVTARQLQQDQANARLAAKKRKEQILKEGPKPLLDQKPTKAQVLAYLAELEAAEAKQSKKK